jgi:oligoribonuclease NrnB/cAMP/cGMP phosphodiesterase (DHH superfamily)
MTKTIVLYHANCMDGFASAWAHNYLVGRQMQDVEYHPMKYDEPLPVSVIGHNVVMLDYSMKLDRVAALCEQCNEVLIIDHHATAIEDLTATEEDGIAPILYPNLTLILDKKHSGCMLTWNFFVDLDRDVPKFLQLIEDRDLWLFNNTSSEAFHAKASTMNRAFDVWDDFVHLDNLAEIINTGRSILSYEDSLVASIAATRYLGQLNGNLAVFCNCPAALTSKTGDFLLKTHEVDLAVMYFKSDNIIKYSLRSTDKVNSAKIAESLGGGGHAKAAGFSTRLEDSHLVKDFQVEQKAITLNLNKG